MTSLSHALNYQTTAFLTSAATLHQCPQDSGFEVAFAGRSNSGKSSALNLLTQSKLARTSKTPGRTRLINFFRIDDTRRLVDLPGYGYAKVAKSMQKSWHKELDAYLSRRVCLQGLVLLMDIRHPFKDFDHMILKWSSISSLPVHILLTKADKVGFSQQQKVLKQVAENIPPHASVQLFSTLKRQGIKELSQKLDQLLCAESKDTNTETPASIQT